MTLNEGLKPTDRSRKTRKADAKKVARMKVKKMCRTFGEELESSLVRTMLDEGMFDWFRRPARPSSAVASAKPAPAVAKFKPMKPNKAKDSAHYRTDHHYGHGDIDPAQVPVFKPSWQNYKATNEETHLSKLHN